MNFQIQIQGLDALKAAFARAPSIVTSILQRAIAASYAVLAKNTRGNVPVRTGNLQNQWSWAAEGLQGIYKPKMLYAAAVEFGMPASPGRYVPAIGKRLIDSSRPGFGMWPGFKANPFMERIVAASQSEIDSTFVTALGQITEGLAAV
jgi:hypothetical protein